MVRAGLSTVAQTRQKHDHSKQSDGENEIGREFVGGCRPVAEFVQQQCPNSDGDAGRNQDIGKAHPRAQSDEESDDGPITGRVIHNGTNTKRNTPTMPNIFTAPPRDSIELQRPCLNYFLSVCTDSLISAD